MSLDTFDFDQCDEKTWPDQEKDNDKDNCNDNEKIWHIDNWELISSKVLNIHDIHLKSGEWHWTAFVIPAMFSIPKHLKHC